MKTKKKFSVFLICLLMIVGKYVSVKAQTNTETKGEDKYCGNQTDTRYEFLIGQTYRFTLTKVEDKSNVVRGHFSMCIEGSPTNPNNGHDNCWNPTKIGATFDYLCSKGWAIALRKSEYDKDNDRFNAAGETKVFQEKGFDYKSWKGNSLRWRDPETGFTVTIDVKAIPPIK